MATLAVAGAMSIIVGASFAFVARAVAPKAASSDGRTALHAFRCWWAALATYLLVQGILTLQAAFGALDPTLHLASRVILVPVLCLSVWGITTYLLYLYTGDRRVFAWVAALYVAVGIAFYWATFSADRAISVERWLVSVDDSSRAYQLVYLAIGLPPILSAVAYLGLLRRVDDRLRRYRILLVSGSIFTYVGSGLVARLSSNDAAIFTTLVLFGALAAVAAVLAFYPPPRVHAWLTGSVVERQRRMIDKSEQRQRRIAELV